MRHFLLTLLTAAPLPRLVSTKLVKVIVDIAKQEWPSSFPEFLPTIRQLTQEPSTLVLGLLMVMTMNEEFTGRHDVIPAARRDELLEVRARSRVGEEGRRRAARTSPEALEPRPAMCVRGSRGGPSLERTSS